MRFAFSVHAVLAVVLVVFIAPQEMVAQSASTCLYNDEHFHIQDFVAQGPRLADIVKMMDNHVCRSTLMALAVTVAHDPLVDRDFAPVYYTQTDGQVLYYNTLQDVLVAHKVLALSPQDRARVDPLMSAFNLKTLARQTTSSRWFSCIRACGAVLARSISRNKNSLKKLRAARRVYTVRPLIRFLM